jgi:hypothetical protein
MENMNISNAQYTQIVSGENSGIKATVNGIELFVPISEGNRHYAEIMRQVDAGELTIADAE